MALQVELTRLQKAYYRAVFDRNRGFLSRGAANTAVANLVNIEMELRKCCNHPYLLRGAEQREGAGLDKYQRIEV
jgi:SNF2 family DNA or RNA helicase